MAQLDLSLNTLGRRFESYRAHISHFGQGAGSLDHKHSPSGSHNENEAIGFLCDGDYVGGGFLGRMRAAPGDPSGLRWQVYSHSDPFTLSYSGARPPCEQPYFHF